MIRLSSPEERQKKTGEKRGEKRGEDRREERREDRSEESGVNRGSYYTCMHDVVPQHNENYTKTRGQC